MARDKTTLLYAETHEWVDVTDNGGQKIATIGISDFAIEQLNDLVYMELPEIGKRWVLAMNSVKWNPSKRLVRYTAPSVAEIIAVHEDLPDSLEGLNNDPYDFGWIIQVKVDDEAPLESLMDYAAYKSNVPNPVDATLSACSLNHQNFAGRT